MKIGEKYKVVETLKIENNISPGSIVEIIKIHGVECTVKVNGGRTANVFASSVTTEGLILSEIDARRGNSFLGLYKKVGKTLVLADDEKLVNLVEYKESIKESYEVISSGEPNLEVILNSDITTLVKDIHGLNPNYLRITEAERNLK